MSLTRSPSGMVTLVVTILSGSTRMATTSEAFISFSSG